MIIFPDCVRLFVLHLVHVNACRNTFIRQRFIQGIYILIGGKEEMLSSAFSNLKILPGTVQLPRKLKFQYICK